jgi:NADH:ubiquinone oxidoreductase subunit B-like Fe-S oxidoreductase
MDKSLLYLCSILVEAFSIACCKIEFLKMKKLTTMSIKNTMYFSEAKLSSVFGFHEL